MESTSIYISDGVRPVGIREITWSRYNETRTNVRTERRMVRPTTDVRKGVVALELMYGGPNDSGIDSLSTGPLARLFVRSLAPDCSLRLRPPLRSLVRSLAHFAHSLARGKEVYLYRMNASPAYSFNPL